MKAATLKTRWMIFVSLDGDLIYSGVEKSLRSAQLLELYFIRLYSLSENENGEGMTPGRLTCLMFPKYVSLKKR